MSLCGSQCRIATTLTLAALFACSGGPGASGDAGAGETGEACDPAGAPSCGGACPTQLARGRPNLVAADAANVYYDDERADGTRVLMKVPIGGGQPTELTSDMKDPQGLASDGTNLYVADYLGGIIAKVPVGGGAVVELVSPVDATAGLAIDAGNVYYASGSAIMSVPTSGGSPATVADRQNYVNAIAVDADHVYWEVGSASIADAVLSAPRTGGTAATLATIPSLSPQSRLAVGGTSIFFTTFDGHVMSVPKGGGAPSMVATSAAGPGGVMNGIAAGPDAVYWLEGQGTTLRKLSLGDGSAVTLSTLDFPTRWGSGGGSLAVYATSVYWTTFWGMCDGTGFVMTTPR